MPLFDYADLVWGDKHNVTLMTSLQALQNKAAKIILDRPLYSSATHKCLNGLVEHDMNFIRQQEQHDYNTRTKLNLRDSASKCQEVLGQTRDCISCHQGFYLP